MQNHIINIPWYVRFLLWFKKPKFSWDVGMDSGYWVMWKSLFGKMCILKVAPYELQYLHIPTQENIK